MIKTFEGKNPNNLYLEMLDYVNRKGELVCPKGKPTKEIYPCITKIENPRERFLTVYGRHINPFFLCAEAVWILAGRDDAKFIMYFNKQLGEYLDKGFRTFHGAYGGRIRKANFGYYKIDQIDSVIRRLKSDNDTRQAVISLWNPRLDIQPSKDIPCNNLSYFKIRNNKLHLHQIIRSNDINLGLFPTNIFQFSMIQEYVASALRVDVGELLFFSDSLHLYTDDTITENVLGHVSYSGYDLDIFDIYEHNLFKFARLSILDRILKCIIINAKEYMNGNFKGLNDIYDITTNCVFWDLNNMIKIYCLRRQGKYIDAIDRTFNLYGFDFKVTALEYHWNKARNSNIGDIQKKKILIGMREDSKFNSEIIKFITNREYEK